MDTKRGRGARESRREERTKKDAAEEKKYSTVAQSWPLRDPVTDINVALFINCKSDYPYRYRYMYTSFVMSASVGYVRT